MKGDMAEQYRSLLSNPLVRSALEQAWGDSRPEATGGHEEGGFILQGQDGHLSVRRWPTGAQNSISLPPHPNCQLEDKDIVASFHTHPNTDESYLQEPSETDKRAIREDPDLKGIVYKGEFVISHQTIYLVSPDGFVLEVEETKNIFPPNRGEN